MLLLLVTQTGQSVISMCYFIPIQSLGRFATATRLRLFTNARRKGIIRHLIPATGLAVIVFAARIALAHDAGLSTVIAQLYPDRLDAVITFAVKDAGELSGLDADLDGQVSPEEFSEGREKLGRAVADSFEVRFDEMASNATNVQCQLDQNNNAEVHLTFPAKAFSKLVLRSKMIALLPFGHRQYFMLQNSSVVMLTEALLNAEMDTVTLQVAARNAAPSSEAGTNAPQVSSVQAAPTPLPSIESSSMSFGKFVLLGVEHIWTGYDHLLFLFALLVVTRSFRSALVVITAFTLAHSITLAVATFNLAQLQAKYTEPLIAASIIYVGVENLVKRGDPHGRWMLTFAFGLI
ncbi:MAG: hypothetical protein HOP33_11615, partial [Verrucomicrobia bacterium]|nr:hypothetical protein [Verrucomicrobiota bacterium]